MGITFRAARPDDVPRAAELLYSTGPAAYNLVFGSPDRALAVIQRLFAMPGNPMSFQYTKIAQSDNSLAGLLILLDSEMEKGTQPVMGKQLLKLFGPLFILSRLPLYLRFGRMTRIPSSSELCIGDIAVSPRFMGKGIAAALMNQAVESAREGGYSLLSLYVLRDNARAIRFYEKTGYSVDEVVFDPWLRRRFGFPGFLRMIKEIS